MNTRLITLIIALCSFGCGDLLNGSKTTLDDHDHTHEGAENGSDELPEGVECITGNDCDDRDPMTKDRCVEGLCVHREIECDPGFEPNEIGDCVRMQPTCEDPDDGNPCTVDACDIETGEPTNTPKTCNDEDATTVDSCNEDNGSCTHKSCIDEDLCTRDLDVDGVCVNEPIDCGDGLVCNQGTCEPAPCRNNGECGDGDPCTMDSCNLETGRCENVTRSCDDGDDTTFDHCVEAPRAGVDFECQHVPTECTGGCDDQDPCTNDSCQNDVCVYEAISCGEGTVCDPGVRACIPAPCTERADCINNNPCVDMICERGQCVVDDEVECGDRAVCNAANGECVALEECPGGCDDNNDATIDRCVDGVCEHHQPAACGPGTALDRESGECLVAEADADCIDGAITCRQLERDRTTRVVECRDGHWFALPGGNCGVRGAPGSLVCIAERAQCVRDPGR